MPTAFNVRALGSTVRIELDDTLSPDQQESIRTHWQDLITEDDVTALQTIHGGLGNSKDPASPTAAMTVVGRSVPELADRLVSKVTLMGIGDLSGEALILHAAAVALDDGRVIGFVGPSGRGKTTAARALGVEFRYVTDETLAIRRDGSVLAYPKPLSIGDRPQLKLHTAASELGLGRAPADDLRLAAIVLLDRQPDIDPPRVEFVELTEALADLIPQTSFFARLDSPLRTLVELIQSTGGVRRVTYSEASTLPPLMNEILSTEHADSAIITDVANESKQGCDCGSGSAAASDEAGTYRRTHHTDAILLDEQLIILRPNEVTVLEGVGPAVWLAAGGSTEEELREAALDQLPEPPAGIDPAAVVSAAVDQLMEAKLLAGR